MIPVSFEISDKIGAHLQKLGISSRLNEAASMLFHAAFAARCKTTGDAELDAAVAEVGKPQSSVIAVPAPPVAVQSDAIKALSEDRDRLKREAQMRGSELALSNRCKSLESLKAVLLAELEGEKAKAKQREIELNGLKRDLSDQLASIKQRSADLEKSNSKMTALDKEKALLANDVMRERAIRHLAKRTSLHWRGRWN